MGSGKYGALSGAISRMQMLENINRNLANSQTSAYKKGVAVFEAQLDEARATRDKLPTNYALVGKEEIDFSPGQLNRTGDPTHLAINGDGFFRIRLDNGDLAYSRRGSFHRTQDGELIDENGARLLGTGDAPVTLPPGDFSLSTDGSIFVDGQLNGSIPLYRFEDTSGLRRGQDGCFLAGADAVVSRVENGEIMQGYLEGSNINIMQEMGRMVYTQRVFEAAQKALLAYDEMDRKLAELGNVQ